MKDFKKITAGFLSLAMLTCVGTSQAFAVDNEFDTINQNGGRAEHSVTVGSIGTPL